jgi:hypothetical protein
MASFGSFSMNTLVASTRALSRNSPGDQIYLDTEQAISMLTDQRNALAAEIRTGFNQAQLGGLKLSQNQIKAWTRAADELLAQAHAMATSP